MTEQKTHTLTRWFEEVWNQGREEMIDELAAPDVVGHTLVDSRGTLIAGREAFRGFWRDFRATFPDIRIKIEDALADGDREMVRCTIYATHRGDGIGLAATNRPVKFCGMVLARVRNGQLVEVWDSWDFLGMYTQLGAMPPSIAMS